MVKQYNQYVFKRLEEVDIPSVKQLFYEVFNKKVSNTYLKNKYNTSYLGVKYICSIAYHGNKPIAFYGALPQKFIRKGKEILVAHACDSFTLESYQRQGLHYQLAKLSYEIMKELDIRMVYAFHSENTYFSTKKLGWKENGSLQRFHFKIQTIPVSKLVNKLKANGVYKLFFKKELPSEAIVKLNLNNVNKFKQHFNKDFIKYKNHIVNHYLIEEKGCVFWVKVEAVLLVGLCYAPSAEALREALKKIKIKTCWLGIPEIVFQVHQKSTIAGQLRELIAPKQSWVLGYLEFTSDIDIQNFLFSHADLDTY